jgi:hypothetical protein
MKKLIQIPSSKKYIPADSITFIGDPRFDGDQYVFTIRWKEGDDIYKLTIGDDKKLQEQTFQIMEDFVKEVNRNL